jgi:hypothetical protein
MFSSLLDISIYVHATVQKIQLTSEERMKLGQPNSIIYRQTCKEEGPDKHILRIEQYYDDLSTPRKGAINGDRTSAYYERKNNKWELIHVSSENRPGYQQTDISGIKNHSIFPYTRTISQEEKNKKEWERDTYHCNHIYKNPSVSKTSEGHKESGIQIPYKSQNEDKPKIKVGSSTPVAIQKVEQQSNTHKTCRADGSGC